jgi:hypothetical protein
VGLALSWETEALGVEDGRGTGEEVLGKLVETAAEWRTALTEGDACNEEAVALEGAAEPEAWWCWCWCWCWCLWCLWW